MLRFDLELSKWNSWFYHIIPDSVVKGIIPLIKQWSGKSKVYLVGESVRSVLSADDNNSIQYPIRYLKFCVESPNGPKKLVEFIQEVYSSVKVVKESSEHNVIIVECPSTFLIESGNMKIGLEFYMPSKITYNDDGTIKSATYSDISGDAVSRDYCCDALYYDLTSAGCTIFDPTEHGFSDVKGGLIRTVLSPEQQFKYHPECMMKGIELHQYYGMKYETGVDEALHWYPEFDLLKVSDLKPYLNTLLLISRHPTMSTHPKNATGSSAIMELRNRGLLKKIIPELDEAWDFNLNSPEYSMSLGDHLMATLDLALLHSSESSYPSYFYSMYSDLVCKKDSKPDIIPEYLELAYAAILHDISKYREHGFSSSGYNTYDGHVQSSKKMAIKILKRLGHDDNFCNHVGELIVKHEVLSPYWDNDHKRFRADKAVLSKLVESLGANIWAECMLIDANNMARSDEYKRLGQVAQFRDRCLVLKEANRDNLSEDLIVTSLGISALPESDRKFIIQEVRKYTHQIALVKDSTSSDGGVSLAASPLSPEKLIELYKGVFDYNFKLFISTKLNGELEFTITDPKDKDYVRIRAAGETLDQLRKAYLYAPDVQEGEYTLNTLFYPEIYIQFMQAKTLLTTVKNIQKEIVHTLNVVPGVLGYSINSVSDRIDVIIKLIDGRVLGRDSVSV